MSKQPNDKPRIVILNIVLMFFVAVEPYLLNTLNSSIDLFQFTSVLYAVDMTFMGISAVLAHILVAEYEKTLSITQMRTYKANRNFQVVFACLFLLSAFPQFFTSISREYLFEYIFGLQHWFSQSEYVVEKKVKKKIKTVCIIALRANSPRTRFA